MSNFMNLVKTQLNINFGVSALKYRFTKEKKKRWEPILIGLAMIFGLGPLLGVYVLLMQSIFIGGSRLGHPEIVLTVAFLFAQVLILIFGIFYLMGSFYFSQDLNILVPLPLKPYEVLGSKFTVVMVKELLTILPILLPPYIIYGVGTGQGFFYWIKALVLLVAAPVLPLVIGSVFTVLLMRVVNVRRNKDLLTIIGGSLGIILSLALNFYVQSVPKNGGEEYLKNLLMSQSGLVDTIGRKFPPSIWATHGLAGSGAAGWGYFLLFITASAVALLVLLYLANKIFYTGLLAGQEAIRKRKTISGTEKNKLFGRVSGPVFALYRREWKVLLRTPVYMLNGLTGSFIGPLIVGFAIMGRNNGSNPGLEIIAKALDNPAYSTYVVLVGLALALFTAGMNLTASTAVSREGQTFWISKIIPVAPKSQVLAKFYQTLTVSVLGVVVTTLVMAFFAGLTVPRSLLLLILGVLGAIPMVALLLMIDVFRPKLIWSSPAEAMKQNMNGILGMLVSLLVMAVLAVVVVVLLLVKAPSWLIFTGIGLVAAVMGALALLALLTLAEKRYREIEM